MLVVSGAFWYYLRVDCSRSTYRSEVMESYEKQYFYSLPPESSVTGESIDFIEYSWLGLVMVFLVPILVALFVVSLPFYVLGWCIYRKH